ncbi:MAG: AmmeMemoRadiSam system protein B [Ignavibacteriae bacterium]|nr:AmmeMemoRadiSam system protein B [Ignavibacteriota bacterium]
MKIRKAYCAGSWYSDDPSELADELDEYLSNVKKENLNVKAIIVPHAGYMYSGQTAAYSFRQLNNKIEKVIVLGTAHRYPLKGASVSDYDYYNSPLGKVKVSECIKDILKEDCVVTIDEADYEEHSIEIEIPFLQRVLGKFEIIPIIVGSVDSTEFSEVLEKYCDEKTVIVASVDLSHFHSYDDAKKLDNYSIECILNLNSEGIDDAEIDSPYAIKALLELAKRKEWKVKLLDYKNSGDIIRDKNRVVGYSAIAFYEEASEVFSKEERELMEKIAKQAVETYIKEDKRIQYEDVPDSFKKRLACFVTLTDAVDLRGCIGTIEPVDKLYKSIIDNAISAATRDPRFSPVSKDELKGLKYEVSVLSEPREINFSSYEELFDKIKEKGVIISKSGSRAVYLPQVWEHFTSPESFLTSLCRKAGLSSGEWKEKEMKFFVFEKI